MAGFSGKTGTVKIGTGAGVTLYEIINWKYEETTSIDEYNSNRTGGPKSAIGGAAGAKGSFDLKIPSSGSAAIKSGSECTVQLHADNTGANFIQCAVVISSDPIEVDINDGKAVSATYNFVRNGADTRYGIFALA